MTDGPVTFENKTSPSFAAATGPCIRCGTTEKVRKVLGANMCSKCHSSGISPRYDTGKRLQDQAKLRTQHRELKAKKQKAVSASARKKRVDSVKKAVV